MKQSLIIGTIMSLFAFLKAQFDNSLFYKLQQKVSKLWEAITDKSFFANYFKTYPKVQRGSVDIKRKIICALRFIFKKIYNALSKSLIFDSVYNYYKKFFVRSIRGCSLFVFCTSAVCHAFGFKEYSVFFLIASILSVVGVLCDKSLSELFSKSVFYKWALKFLEIDADKTEYTEKNSVSHLVTHVILGVLSGFFAVYTDNIIMVFVIPVLVVSGFMIYDYRVGIFAALISMPFAPTMGVVALCLVSFFSFVLKYLKDKDFKLIRTPLDTPVAIFTLVMLISSVTSFARMSSLKIFLVYFAFVLAFYVTVNAIRSKKQLYGILISMLFAGVFVALYGIYQHIFGFAEGTTWTDTEMFDSIATRVVSTFGNPNVLGEYLLLLIPVSAGFILARPNKFNKLVSLLITALLSLCMIYTYSRGNWIGLIVAIVLFCMFYDGRIAWLGVLCAFFVPMLLPDTVIQRFLSVGDTGDTSTSYRVYIWMGTIAMLKDYWLCGIGLGSDAFNMIYPFYSYSGIVAPHSHNLYLHIMTENGVMGIVAFFVIVITYYRMAISTIVKGKKDKMINAVIIGLSAGMFGYLVQGLFDNVWYNYRIVFMFYVIVALTCAAINIKREAQK